MDSIDGIEGLRWIAHARSPNGGDAHAVRIPSMNPINVGFCGIERVPSGERLSLHVGTAHRITFLGDPARTIRGSFIDCRRGSASRLRRVSIVFGPDSTRALCIPPGVAHTFTGLDGMFTVDAFELFLPDLRSLLNGTSAWGSNRGVRSFDLASPKEMLPVVDACEHAASEDLYALLSEEIRAELPAPVRGFPHAEVLQLLDESEGLLDRRTDAGGIPDWEPIAGVHGAGWKRNTVLTSPATGSGLVVMNEPGTLQIVDHGVSHYEHGAYGIHRSTEDRLTFLGAADRLPRLKMVDCREGSPTLHAEIEVHFRPSPFRQLVIPPGVGHAFEGLERIFTINRAKPYLDGNDSYPGDQRTVEWPLDRGDFPTFPQHAGEPPRELVRHLVEGERRLLAAR